MAKPASIKLKRITEPFGLLKTVSNSLVAVALRHEIEASQHYKHGAGNAQPEAGDQNLPNDKRLARRQADHDAQAVDDVENYGADGEKKRQELNSRRNRHANSHHEAENAKYDKSDGHIVGKTLLNVLRDGRFVDVLKSTEEIGKTLASYRLLFSSAICRRSGIHLVCFRFRHKPTSLLVGTPSNIIKPRSYP